MSKINFWFSFYTQTLHISWSDNAIFFQLHREKTIKIIFNSSLSDILQTIKSCRPYFSNKFEPLFFTSSYHLTLNYYHFWPGFYSSSLLNGLPVSNPANLEYILRMAAKMNLLKLKSSYVSPLLKSLRQLPFHSEKKPNPSNGLQGSKSWSTLHPHLALTVSPIPFSVTLHLPHYPFLSSTNAT